MSKPESYLDHLRKQRIQLRDLTEWMSHNVAAARASGATWEQIGDALATTKQAAQQHYGIKP